MTTNFRLGALGLIAAIALAPVNSARGQDFPAGYWEGVIGEGRAVSPFSVRFGQADARIVGEISFPRSGNRDVLLDEVDIKDDSIRFLFRGRPNDRIFEGKGGASGIAGEAVINGKKLPFTLTPAVWDPPYSEEDLTWRNGGITIAGTLFVPKGPGPHPALVMMHGSGDNERRRYRFLADFFAREGVACLFADKRGCGESTGDWHDADFEALARDGLAGAALLKQRPDIDPRRIGMTGISQAGWVMLQAAAISDDLAFLIVDSGATYDVEREGWYDFEVKLRDLGYSEEDLAEAHKIMQLDNQVTRADGEGFDELMAARREASRKPWFNDMGFIPSGPKSPFRRFYKLILDFDPRPLLEEIDIPILWLYGSEDKSVSAAESVAILEEIQREYKKDYTIRVFPGADHGLRVVPDPETDALPFRVLAGGYLDAKAQWLRERVLNTQ
jgi:pimeloyl-ACP methyl ester carboxylesterase